MEENEKLFDIESGNRNEPDMKPVIKHFAGGVYHTERRWDTSVVCWVQSPARQCKRSYERWNQISSRGLVFTFLNFLFQTGQFSVIWFDTGYRLSSFRLNRMKWTHWLSSWHGKQQWLTFRTEEPKEALAVIRASSASLSLRDWLEFSLRRFMISSGYILMFQLLIWALVLRFFKTLSQTLLLFFNHLLTSFFLGEFCRQWLGFLMSTLSSMDTRLQLSLENLL